MSLQYFKSLLQKAERIQQAIEREQGSRWKNWAYLLRLKKLRLVLKDELRQAVRDSLFGNGVGRLQPAKAQSGFRQLK